MTCHRCGKKCGLECDSCECNGTYCEDCIGPHKNYCPVLHLQEVQEAVSEQGVLF